MSLSQLQLDLGLVIQTVLILGAGYAMLLRSDWSNKALRHELSSMKIELKKLADVVILQAVHAKEIEQLREQFTMLYKTIEDLRRGNGFVRGRKGLDGEYKD